jgi:hypothetical protein
MNTDSKWQFTLPVGSKNSEEDTVIIQEKDKDLEQGGGGINKYYYSFHLLLMFKSLLSMETVLYFSNQFCHQTFKNLCEIC